MNFKCHLLRPTFFFVLLFVQIYYKFLSKAKTIRRVFDVRNNFDN